MTVVNPYLKISKKKINTYLYRNTYTVGASIISRLWGNMISVATYDYLYLDFTRYLISATPGVNGYPIKITGSYPDILRIDSSDVFDYAILTPSLYISLNQPALSLFNVEQTSFKQGYDVLVENIPIPIFQRVTVPPNTFFFNNQLDKGVIELNKKNYIRKDDFSFGVNGYFFNGFPLMYFTPTTICHNYFNILFRNFPWINNYITVTSSYLQAESVGIAFDWKVSFNIKLDLVRN